MSAPGIQATTLEHMSPGPERTSHASRRRRWVAMAGLVAAVTVRELLRRRAALALALLLPLTFYLVRIDVHWTALRLLSVGLGWATATLALFSAVAARSLDRRLSAMGASPSALVVGRHVAILALGWVIGALYSVLVLATIGDVLEHPEVVPLMLLLTATVAAPLGTLAAAVVPRDLEGALLLLAVMAVQVLVDPVQEWTRVLPLWSTRELATYAVEAVGSSSGEHLWRGLTHGVGAMTALTCLSWMLGARRLRTVRLPEP